MANADRLIDVFNEAKARPTEAERQRFVAEACADDPGMKQQVLSLLQAHDGAADFLQPAPLLSSTVLITEKPGDRIGRYKLLEKIGEGGCGVVYMAEQEEPVRRRVALKVIKLGMDTKSVMARFEAERQALALMDHPNIARVFDAGATDTGRPFFVMELVRGTKITDYCDQNNLSTEERLKLFTQVCQAIQHAHQKGIIHRDIKPSNILVTVNDGAPVPKVIDFGIAKATCQRLTDKTLFTQFQSFIGTPAYTSPEQAEMSSVDIDTRSDIYSLGVLLYELLTGKTPFDGEQLLRSGLDEMRRIIRDDQPLRPSNRLDTLGMAEATLLSGKRKTSVPELAGDLRGDLDWIVMKCLEKDRARRYVTANGIGADIQRYLNHEPVTARPPSRLYHLQKLAQRNRGPLLAAAMVFVALLVALLALATSNARIRQERDQKDHALLERAAALEAARGSEQRAREQLFVSLQNQAQARRSSHQMGQRIESLAALAEAARIHPSPELRDNAIAALAIPDVQLGPAWRGWNEDTKAFAYDSLYQRYARMSQDGIISIRTVPEDRELQRLESNRVHSDGARMQFAFSPDGRFLYRLDEDGKLVVWRWESSESVLNSPPAKCSALAFSADGRRIAVGHEAWITCFDLRTGEESRRWQTRDRACTMDFHPDGRRLAVGYYQSSVVSIYNVDDGEQMADLPMGGSRGTTVAWHPDGNLLATGGSDPRIQIWDVKARRKVAVLEGHAQRVTTLNFHSDGNLLTSGSWDGVVRLWQPSPGRQLMRLPIAVWMGSSREGQWAGVISPANLQAQLWGIVPSQEYHTFLNTFGTGQCELYDGDISPDGNLLALGTSDGARLWDLARGREVAWLRMGYARAVLFRAGGHELLTCGPGDGLRRWRIEANAKPEDGLQVGPPHQIALPFAPSRIAKGHDDRTVAVVGESTGQCVLLDLITESVQGPEMLHFNGSFVALSANGERLATSGWHSRELKLWDGQSGNPIKELDVGLTSQVFFTPDNREMIVARAKEFIFHDLRSLEVSRRMSREIGLYPGHVAFTADGKLMALEMAPGLVHLKEVTSGRTVAKLEDPHGELSTWMSFTPDGTQLVVAARYAGAIHRWDLRAIRERLKTMNLDWDWPAFSEPPPGETLFSKNRQLLRVQIVGARPAAVTQPSATNASPAKP
jgi:serine/threonine protein kinase/WD40 repeat protein